MLQALKNLADTFVSLVTFFINFIKSIVMLITNIPKFATYLLSLLTVIPNVYLIYATATISIGIVLFIVGRQK